MYLKGTFAVAASLSTYVDITFAPRVISRPVNFIINSRFFNRKSRFFNRKSRFFNRKSRFFNRKSRFFKIGNQDFSTDRARPLVPPPCTYPPIIGHFSGAILHYLSIINREFQGADLSSPRMVECTTLTSVLSGWP